ncbi:regulator of volume decrease after cellular swelling-domain-containing protein [Hypoxylon trugodes]|uniref:regulator of volume decrease after cellular swelling-domain-containing protein n=1 Tax=Hypoxylon trugodes TaxID=326681 RepID=UPI002199A6E1|nr:regulator of volume decrease after cellular swelling-domain-containing protein [Hypoxylon trugodes]KAI1391393.1 regulator of volume decrease after cellular swelling-domain-containing protein [Hypoxylon trugodes]
MLPPTVIRTCPSADNDFQPLSEYQAQTPDTFFDGKPVLYYHDENVKAWVSAEQYERLYFFTKASGDGSASLNPTPPECYALENNWGKHLHEEKVEVFVASSKFILFSHSSGTGIEIPYPAITLHALKNFRHVEKPDEAASKFIGVYMQLEFSGSGEDDDEGFDPIELTLIPYKALPKEQPPTEAVTVDPLNSERATALFNQVSACSNLHPDPHEEGEEEDEDDDFDRIVFEGNSESEAVEGLPGVFRGDLNGGLPPPMPGSSGWITAENVNQYFDEDGNWIGGEDGVSGELGDGAGRVRGRDEVEEDGANGVENGEDTDSKRPRTE